MRIERCPFAKPLCVPKIPKYYGKSDMTKHLNNYKTHMSLREAIFLWNAELFQLNLSGAAKIWYSKLPPRSIRSLREFKSSFLKRYAISKVGEGSNRRLQDIRQQPEKTLKCFVSRCTDEMTYCVQVTDYEALSALRECLNMNYFFGRIYKIRTPLLIYDVLLEMMKREIINEELINLWIELVGVSCLNKDSMGEDPPPTWWTISWTRPIMRLLPTQDKHLPQPS